MPEYSPIDVSKTALLIIDAQKVYSNPDSPLYCKDFTVTVDNINSLSKSMRANGKSKIVVVKHVYKADKSDVGRLGDFGIADLWNETNPLSAMDESLVMDTGKDMQVSKTRYSAFVNTGLEETLKDAGIDTLIVAGFMTQFCVTTTTRHAHDLDFKVIVPSDANDGPDLPDMPIDVTKKALNAAFNIAVADNSTTTNIVERLK